MNYSERMGDVSSTDRRLLEVATDHFGRLGREGASTRAIARDADTLMSSITYHFSGKDGLYLACAEHIAATMHEKIAPTIETLSDPVSVSEAKDKVEALMSRLVAVMMQDEIAPIARFVVREQMSPTPAFDILYGRAMRHVVEPLVTLLRTIAGGRLDEETARIRAFSLIGQVLALRFGRAALLRTTRWESVGQRETQLAASAILANVRAILGALEVDAA
jgi:AcrR family transcriptional regulator